MNIYEVHQLPPPPLHRLILTVDVRKCLYLHLQDLIGWPCASVLKTIWLAGAFAAALKDSAQLVVTWGNKTHNAVQQSMMSLHSEPLCESCIKKCRLFWPVPQIFSLMVDTSWNTRLCNAALSPFPFSWSFSVMEEAVKEIITEHFYY